MLLPPKINKDYRFMNRQILSLLIVTLFITGCNQQTEGPEKPEFKAPMGPYGLPYQVGNLGGKAVNLPEGVRWLEYEDSPVLNPENRRTGYKPPPRNYNSIITSFGVIMKYPTGLVLVRYRKAPRDSSKQYDAEINLADHQWIDIGVNAGRRYENNLTGAFINSTLNSTVRSQKIIKEYSYIYIYIPSNQHEYGLEKHIPHPEWVESSRYKETTDLYIQKNEEGKVTTLIRCSNTNVALARKCSMQSIMEPAMKVLLDVQFQRVHLKDWQLIQQQSEKIIKSYIVQPK